MISFDITQSAQGYWQVKSNRLGLEIKTIHLSKAAAITYADERAGRTVHARVLVHNEDGSIHLTRQGKHSPENSAITETIAAECPLVECGASC